MTHLRQIVALTAAGFCLSATAAIAQPGESARRFFGTEPVALPESPSNAGAGAFSEQPQLLSQFDRGQGGDRLMEALDLSADQRRQLEAIRAQYQPQLSQQREALQAEMKQLQQMMSGTASESELRAQHSQVVQLSQDMSELRFESMLASRNVLTPEQRAQFAQLLEERRAQFGQRLRDRFRR